MVKKYVITFSISVLVLFSVSVIMLMLMIPQDQNASVGTVQKYEKVNTADYQFVQTKNISKETLVKEYTIDAADIANFKRYNQYKAGNSDPFTPQSDLQDTSNNNNQDKTNDNTKNSNGGVPNPPSTNK
jgi:hypothetical protein